MYEIELLECLKVLKFSDKHSWLAELSSDRREAQRVQPTVEFKKSIVISETPIRNDEEVIILNQAQNIEKWSLITLELGLTKHKPSNLFNSDSELNNLYHLKTDIIMWSGSSIYKNGKLYLHNHCKFDLEKC